MKTFTKTFSETARLLRRFAPRNDVYPPSQSTTGSPVGECAHSCSGGMEPSKVRWRIPRRSFSEGGLVKGTTGLPVGFHSCFLIVVLFFPIVSLIVAAPDNPRRAAIPEPDAAETIKMETECARLEKEFRASPDNRWLQTQWEKSKKVLYKRHLKAGRELEKQGYILSAIGSYRRALLYDSQGRSALKALAKAKARLAKKDRKEAETFYQEGLKAYQEGDRDTAVDAWKKALELDPQNGDAQAALEQLNPHEDSSRKDRGQGRLTGEDIDGLPLDPLSKESVGEQNMRTGAEQMRLGEYEEAAESFRKALEYSPNDEEARRSLAQVEAILGRRGKRESSEFYWLGVKALQTAEYRRAYEFLRQSAKADPYNKETQQLLADLMKKHPEVIKIERLGKNSPLESGQK